MTVLGMVKASSRGVALPNDYRAVLVDGDNPSEASIRIEQPIDGSWHPTGGCWYLKTLIAGGSMDSISIDYGQQWSVTSGLWPCIANAWEIVASQ
jgi:hypothetical protein